jgi:peptidyl-prolyl cis-trans isomerase D
MSIIQKIRDKAAWIIIVAIAVALIAFIVEDALRSRSMFSSSSTVIGEINGHNIDAIAFEEKYKRAEDMYNQQGYPMNDMMKSNIRESIWGEYLDSAIMTERYDQLGLMVPETELNDILFGANPPQDMRRQFTDQKTGQYDANLAYQQISALKKQKNSPMYQSFYFQYVPALEMSRKKEKYISLLSQSAYAPKWMVQRLINDNSQKAAISYVTVPYTTVSDSSVRISDQQITDYVSKHPDEYKQEKSRTIEYVMFDAGPTRADSGIILSQVQAVKDEFSTTKDVPAFLVRNGSESSYTAGYEQKSKMRSQNLDSITALGEGQVGGPYLEGSMYVLAKLMDKRTLPDSVKVRHILIKTSDRGKPVLPDSLAKTRLDSIVTAIKGGASFDSMVVRYSDDDGSKAKGGEYDFTVSQFGEISKEFAETIFYGFAGDKKIVKVDNANYGGYHYIEVLSQKNFEPAFNIAYFSKSIVPSEETTNREMGIASQFAAESRSKKQFDDNARAKKYNKLIAVDVKPLDATVSNLGSSRELVKWIYEADPGDISERPIAVEDKFVVPMVTRVYEEGTMAADKARPLVENILRNRQKSDQIIAKIGSASTLDAVAKTTAQPIGKSDSISFGTAFIPNVGQEPKVIGASFNKANQTKISAPIPGNGGVFVIKVENISALSTADINIAQQQQQTVQMEQRAFADSRAITEILKKTVKIRDNRYKFF